MVEHTVRSFGEELDVLAGEVARMGGVAEWMVSSALDAVAHGDNQLARQVIERDAEVDEMERDLERRAIRLIALRQPLAQDLRDTVAALKVPGNLERIGDLAKNIAKRSTKLGEQEAAAPTRSLERMGRNVVSLLKDVLDAYSNADADLAMQVWARDEAITHVIVRAAGDRAFCAGGDIRALYLWGKANNPIVTQFYLEEYRLNTAIKNYPKPYIAIMNGITMGGGVGISVHGSHRIVTERLAFAMPEKIGRASCRERV